jgi:hypothetical protein
MWLTSGILNWESDVDSWTGYEDESWRRVYAIWNHAEHLLRQPSTEFGCVDAITTLKRVIKYRIRHLNEIYEFRQIPVKNKPSDTLELMSYLGIVRPKMVQKLIEVRNAVEHQDAKPPNQDVCLDFLEFTWYFLRSTDMLVRRPVSGISLSPTGDDIDPKYYGVSIEFGPGEGWIPKIIAWVEPSLISLQPIDDWFSLKVEETETREAMATRLKEPVDPTGWDSGRGKNPKDMYIRAEIRGPSHHLLRLYQVYFETV